MANIALVQLVAFVFGFFGGIIMITGLSTHHWCRRTEIVPNQTEVVVHSGLWEACIVKGVEIHCYSSMRGGEVLQTIC